jgi:TRAP-type mannitol/chloroaromatic compound transport system substrate-binding protein
MSRRAPQRALSHAAQRASRRKFLGRTAAAAAGGVATLTHFPAIAAAPSALVLRLQGAWSSKDIFHEYALDFATRVRDMTGGELRIQVLPAGAVVPADGLLNAVSKGALDGGHGVLGHHYLQHSAFALWGSGPAFGMDANLLLAWHKYGGGRELLDKLYKSIGVSVVSFPYGPMPTQPLGWFKKPVVRVEDLKGLKLRALGMGGEIYGALGAAVKPLPEAEIVSALKSGALDAAEFNNASSDRTLGLPQVTRVCMLQSYHQNAEQFEIMFNRAKYDALPAPMKAIVENAVEAASADMSWKAIDRYSQDYAEMQQKQGVRFFKTAESILQRQLAAFDEAAEKKAKDEPMFREILESQRRFAARAVKWDLDTNVERRTAYQHYFSRQAQKKPARKP